MTEHSHHEHDHEHDHLEGHEGHEHITIVDEEGNEILHEVLFTFESEDYNKSYVLCYPAGIPEGEEVEFDVEDGEKGPQATNVVSK